MGGDSRTRPRTKAAIYQASLTGQLVLSSFHAGVRRSGAPPAGNGTAPYMLRSGVRGRHLSAAGAHRLCSLRAGRPAATRGNRWDLTVAKTARVGSRRGAVRAADTREGPWLGEMLPIEQGRGRGIASAPTVARLEAMAKEEGRSTWQRAIQAVRQGRTIPEIRRVLGFLGFQNRSINSGFVIWRRAYCAVSASGQRKNREAAELSEQELRGEHDLAGKISLRLNDEIIGWYVPGGCPRAALQLWRSRLCLAG